MEPKINKSNCATCTHKNVCKYKEEFESLSCISENKLPSNAMMKINCYYYMDINLNFNAPKGGNVAQRS